MNKTEWTNLSEYVRYQGLVRNNQKKWHVPQLKNTHEMIQRLDLDLQQKKIIHVAGSNGKGTACALMSASLTLSGYSNLLFTSPHVSRGRKRRIDCKPISKDDFDFALKEIYHLSKGETESDLIKLTFFEVTFLVSLICAFKIKGRRDYFRNRAWGQI